MISEVSRISKTQVMFPSYKERWGHERSNRTIWEEKENQEEAAGDIREGDSE